MELTITKETIKELFTKAGEEFKSKTADWKPKHWFIAGAILILITNTIFPVLTIITNALTWVMIVIFYYFGLMIGMGEERSWELIELLYWESGDQTILENPYYATDALTYLTDIVTLFILWSGETGRKIWEVVIDYFPVLLDFQLDLDFVNIDFVKILRSVFSVLQFVIIFIILRKIRIYLRKVIKMRINDNDYFDKQFFQEVRI